MAKKVQKKSKSNNIKKLKTESKNKVFHQVEKFNSNHSSKDRPSRIQKNAHIYHNKNYESPSVRPQKFSSRKINFEDDLDIHLMEDVNKKVLVVFLLFVLIFIYSVFLMIQKQDYKKQIQTLKIEKEELKDENDKVKMAREKEKFEIKNLLLGDSITFYYNTHRFFKKVPVQKSAVSGYTSEDIINNFNSMVTSYNPKNVVLLIGTNDIERGYSNQKILDNIKTIVERVRKHPSSIMIQSIYPVNESEEYSPGVRRNNRRIKTLNAQIKKYCDKEKIPYIDVYPSLIDKNDNLKKEYTSDGLHVSDEGYEKITSIIEEYLQ